jgi:hypothetical protein
MDVVIFVSLPGAVPAPWEKHLTSPGFGQEPLTIPASPIAEVTLTTERNHFEQLMKLVRNKRPISLRATNWRLETLEAEMNHSIHSADRATHWKIVAVALVAGIMVTAFGIAARSGGDNNTQTAARVIKAGKPVVITSSDSSTVR